MAAFEAWHDFGNPQHEIAAQVQRRQELQDADLESDDGENGYNTDSAYEEF